MVIYIIQIYTLPGSSQTTQVLTNISSLLVVDSAVKIVSETSHPAQRSLFIANFLQCEHIYCRNAYACTCTCTLLIQMYGTSCRTNSHAHNTKESRLLPVRL